MRYALHGYLLCGNERSGGIFMSEKNRKLFTTPFSAEYWRLSAREMKSIHMLVIAALLTALRIAVKSLRIQLGPDLYVTFGFVINALGSMIYGPVVAGVTSAISDILGALLFPSGAYFFPFTLVEMAGGVIFAMFFYRAKITTSRVVWGRFAVTAICNLILNPITLYYYNMLFFTKSYMIFSLPRVVKNLALFPVQSLILIVFFNAMLPITNRMGLTHTGNVKLSIEKKDIKMLVLLTAVSAVAVALYYIIMGII